MAIIKKQHDTQASIFYIRNFRIGWPIFSHLNIQKY